MKSWTTVILGWCLLGLSLIAAAAPGILQGPVDLTARLHAVGSADSIKRHMPVTRQGRQADAVILVAPVIVRASLAGIKGPCRLRLLATPAFNIGDGMQMDLSLTQSGEGRKIFSRYFDAGRIAGDRAWVRIEVPLDLPPASEVYLEIQVSGGPQGDLVADWLAIAEIELVPVSRKP
jgi:hypothetical protein